MGFCVFPWNTSIKYQSSSLFCMSLPDKPLDLFKNQAWIAEKKREHNIYYHVNNGWKIQMGFCVFPWNTSIKYQSSSLFCMSLPDKPPNLFKNQAWIAKMKREHTKYVIMWIMDENFKWDFVYFHETQALSINHLHCFVCLSRTSPHIYSRTRHG